MFENNEPKKQAEKKRKSKENNFMLLKYSEF